MTHLNELQKRVDAAYIAYTKVFDQYKDALVVGAMGEFKDSFIAALIDDLNNNDLDDGIEREHDLELHLETAIKIKSLCDTFFNENLSHIIRVETVNDTQGNCYQYTGYLFYMTLVGHGVGLWDICCIKDNETRVALSRAVDDLNVNLGPYVGDDGKVHLESYVVDDLNVNLGPYVGDDGKVFYI